MKEIACRWFFTNMPAFSTSVTGWGITRQGLLDKCPGGWIYFKGGKCKKGEKSTWVLRCCECSLPSFPVQWVCAVLQWGWSVTRCCLWEKGEGELMLGLMEKSLSRVQGLRGLCSRHVISCSCDRSACDEDGQVFLACLQGDADEASGCSSQYIYIYIYIYIRGFIYIIRGCHIY